MKTISYLITGAFLFLQSYANNKQGDCNLLKIYSEQHKYLEFVECKKGEGQTIKYATYSVSGNHASEVETYLIDKYGMGKLTFMCCGWEPENGTSGTILNNDLTKINPAYHLAVRMMGSAEKKDDKDMPYLEKDRNKIDYFYVTVSLLEV